MTLSPIQCKNCVLDTTASNITFNEEGICNYCEEYEVLSQKTVLRPEEVKTKELNSIVNKIKAAGKNNEYDCILGISGGVDSTYLALLSKQLGLRPLIMHFDNGWNSEMAVKNIENIVNKLEFDLFTYVMDWEEFKDIQTAYFRASVLDIEVPTDQFIFAALHKIAYQKGIKYILSGHNIVTEAILPPNWCYSKLDLVNLKDIHKKHGKLKLKKLPKLGLYQRHFYHHIHFIQSVALLNYIPYVKSDIKKRIKEELGWQDYGGKHYESIFTRFYQGYILPRKFNIDKRKAHLSNLIVAGQVTREEALEELKKPTYPIEQQEEDKQFFIKKLNISEQEFDSIMKESIKPHNSYNSEHETMYQFKYFLFRIVAYFPVRILRLLRVLPSPPKFHV